MARIKEKESVGLDGASVVLSGFRSESLDEAISAAGGVTRIKPSSKTTVVVVPKSGYASAAVDYAKENKIKVLTLEKFCAKYGLEVPELKKRGRPAASEDGDDDEVVKPKAAKKEKAVKAIKAVKKPSKKPVIEDDENDENNEDDDDVEVVKPKKAVKKPAVKEVKKPAKKPVKKPVIEDDNEDDEEIVPKKAKAVKAVKKPSKKPVIKDDDDDDEVIVPKKEKAVKAVKKPAKKPVIDDDDDDEEEIEAISSKKVFDESDNEDDNNDDENSERGADDFRPRSDDTWKERFSGLESAELPMDEASNGIEDIEYDGLSLKQIRSQVKVISRKILEDKRNGYKVFDIAPDYLGYLPAEDMFIVSSKVRNQEHYERVDFVAIKMKCEKVQGKSGDKASYTFGSADVVKEDLRRQTQINVIMELDDHYGDIVHLVINSTHPFEFHDVDKGGRLVSRSKRMRKA